MAFFNKKEEVIDIQLTQYGKHLLSKGEFRPVSYAFFDDNVLYDSSYAGLETESQNSIEPRIQEDTPALKTQYIYYGAETEILRIAEEIRGTNGAVPSMQPVADKHYALAAPLGTSALHTDKLPSWHLRYFAAELDDSIQYVTGAHPTMKIPQLSSNIVYKTEMYDNNSISPNIAAARKGGFGSTVKTQTSVESEYMMTSQKFDDGTYFVTTGDQLLVEITEQNTDFFKENFDIEVFIVEEVDVTGSVKTPGMNTKKNKKEILRPLNFPLIAPTVVDGLLVRPDVQKTTDQDQDDVGYYFEVNVDNEIPPETLCAIIANLKSQGADLGYLTDIGIECPDRTGGPGGSLSPGADIPFDLYSSNVSEEDIEECLD